MNLLGPSGSRRAAALFRGSPLARINPNYLHIFGYQHRRCGITTPDYTPVLIADCYARLLITTHGDEEYRLDVLVCLRDTQPIVHPMSGYVPDFDTLTQLFVTTTPSELLSHALIFRNFSS